MTEAQASTGTQLAVIFGAGGGIGSELARLLAADGLRVALIDKDASAVDAIAAEIGAAGAGVYPADITVDAEVQELAARIGTELGPPNLLINSIGWLGPFEMTSATYAGARGAALTAGRAAGLPVAHPDATEVS